MAFTILDAAGPVIPVSLAYAGLAGLPPQAECTIICSAASATRCSACRANSPWADLGDLFESVADAVESFESEKP